MSTLSSSTASPSTASQPTSMSSRPLPTSSWPSPIAPQPSSMVPRPSSMVPPSSSMASGLTMALWSSSMAPHISNSTHNLHQGPPIPFPQQRLFLHPFANPIPQPSMCFSLKEQHIHHFLTSVLFCSLSTTLKWLSRARPRCFGSSHLSSPTTHSFQQPLNFLAHPFLDTFQPYEDEGSSPGEVPSLVVIDDASDAPSSIPNIHSISSPASSCDLYQDLASLHPHDFHQYSVSLHSPTPTSSFPQ